MKDLASEFQAVSNLYLQLTEDLGKIDGALENPQPFVKSILEMRERIARIEQLNSRVLELAEEWKQCRAGLNPQSRDQISLLAETVRGQAVRLNALCGAQAKKLETVREGIGRQLAEVGNGRRYLKSVKPSKTNYPKFIDSLY